MISRATTHNTDAEHLSGEHRRMLVEESGIAPDIIRERGYYTAASRSNVPKCFPKYQRRIGCVMPMFSPDGKRGSFQLRPDKPRINPKTGKQIKYEAPCGQDVLVDAHPRNMSAIRDASAPLWITEGIKKGDALASRGAVALSLTGVWNFKVGQTHDQLLPCFDHVALEGREVTIVFDADVMVKAEVQSALGRLIPPLERRGAVVRVAYLPGPEKGVDDYLAAGHSMRELRALAREFKPQDFARIRLSKNERLRRAVSYLEQTLDDMPTVRQGENTNRCGYRQLVLAAAQHGKIVGDGVRVVMPMRRLAEHMAVSYGTAVKTVRCLEDQGLVRRDTSPRRKDEPGALVLLTPGGEGRANGDHIESKSKEKSNEVIEGETGNPDRYHRVDPGDHQMRGGAHPELRWSGCAVHHERDKRGNVVIKRETLERIGKKRGEIIRYLSDQGTATLGELVQRFGGERTRPRDFRVRTLQFLVDAEIVRGEGDTYTLTEDWPVALERARALGREQEAAELQAERHRRASKAYRERHKIKPEPVPEPPQVDDLRQGWQHHPEGCACRECTKRHGRVIGEHVAGCKCAGCTAHRRAPGASKDAKARRYLRLVKDSPPSPPPPVPDAHRFNCECDECIYPTPRYARVQSGGR